MDAQQQGPQYVELAGMHVLPGSTRDWATGALGVPLVRVSKTQLNQRGVERWVNSGGEPLVLELHLNRYAPGQAYCFLHGQRAAEIAEALHHAHGGCFYLNGAKIHGI